MYEVPIGGHPVFRRVLTHRGDENAIAKGSLADGEGVEEMRHERGRY